MRSIYQSKEGEALNKMFDLVAKLERDKRELEKTIDDTKMLLLKGKTDEAIKLILREDKR